MGQRPVLAPSAALGVVGRVVGGHLRRGDHGRGAVLALVPGQSPARVPGGLRWRGRLGGRCWAGSGSGRHVAQASVGGTHGLGRGSHAHPWSILAASCKTKYIPECPNIFHCALDKRRTHHSGAVLAGGGSSLLPGSDLLGRRNNLDPVPDIIEDRVVDRLSDILGRTLRVGRGNDLVLPVRNK